MTILVVLESPNKIKKVQSFIGDNYIVSASKGHIRTLGKHNELGIDIDNNYTPKYLNDDNKSMVISKLKSELKKSSEPKKVIIATDYDREGEAIGWHIMQVLGIKNLNNAPRLVFKEITEKALVDSLKNPTTIDMNMVYSQQARMILDKLLGFKLCDVIHKNFKNYKLSAGRVQSVISRLIIEREELIKEHNEENYFRTNANLIPFNNNNINYDIILKGVLNKDYDNIDDSNTLMTRIKEHNILKIKNKSRKTLKRNPSPPFITSSLQQEASHKLHMSPKTCMSVAQKLYEAGFITYMRTDSLTLSTNFLNDCKKYIVANYGETYYKRTQYNKKVKGSQDAHEACRPVKINILNVNGKEKCGPSEQRLYNLIWKRSIASQMSPAEIDSLTFHINHPYLEKTNNAYFISKNESILFDGFMKIYGYNNSDNNDDNNSTEYMSDMSILENLNIDDTLLCNNLHIEEKLSKPKNMRFTESSLVKELERLGIGRPSTYASMVDKVQSKKYVERRNIDGKTVELYDIKFNYPNDVTVDKCKKKVGAEKNKLTPTPLGIMINEYLLEHFDNVVNYGFTSSVEEQLDKISSGELQWYNVVDGVYNYIKPTIDKLLLEFKGGGSANKSPMKRELGIHPDTKKPVYVLKTRKGWFILEEDVNDKKKSRWGDIIDIGKKPEDITLEDALKTLRYPYVIGNYKRKPITVYKANSIYLKYDGNNLSIDNYIKQNKFNKLIPSEIGKEDAVKIIEYYQKMIIDKKNNMKEDVIIPGVEDAVIKHGPYGYYIKYMKMYNVKLPAKFKKSIDGLNDKTVLDCISKFLKNKK